MICDKVSIHLLFALSQWRKIILYASATLKENYSFCLSAFFPAYLLTNFIRFILASLLIEGTSKAPVSLETCSLCARFICEKLNISPHWTFLPSFLLKIVPNVSRIWAWGWACFNSALNRFTKMPLRTLKIELRYMCQHTIGEYSQNCLLTE